MRFARWVFLAAGVYGVLVLVPQSFMERQINAEMPAGDHASGVVLGSNIGPALRPSLLALSLRLLTDQPDVWSILHGCFGHDAAFQPSILKRAPMEWLKSAGSQLR